MKMKWLSSLIIAFMILHQKLLLSIRLCMVFFHSNILIICIRMLQLQLLTRRNDPAPAQTWGQDVARVLASGSDAANARRLQNVLKTLLRK